MSKVAVLGRHGLIGKALWNKFENPYNYLRPDLDYVYWFAAPSSQILFNYAPDYCKKETVMGFVNVLEYCRQNDIFLVYPSSATVYESSNDYADCKRQLEYIHAKSINDKVLGLRIFAGYGHEEDKGEYASVVYQFCKMMKNGDSPVIWGDGEQSRDFVFVEDIAQSIINHTGVNGIIDIGTGINTTFNELVRLINEELHTDIKPIYKKAPKRYIKSTPCKSPIAFDYSIRDGIHEICSKLN